MHTYPPALFLPDTLPPRIRALTSTSSLTAVYVQLVGDPRTLPTTFAAAGFTVIDRDVCILGGSDAVVHEPDNFHRSRMA
ncbi:hypothetical protein FIBSPDRAFT_865755 [Athelia psychrophila]|uniref:Uncharacterized protein n=1 Tax=Athelia psychrophila TaxID=1759441 RepID=A0A166FAL4_9AGAM|nr:hypothetical protein FIBSPDRAFT_865755 [Fibularhizoctonia sp. CBS 109695]